jgi:S1-C subfamily serine protease
MARDGEGVPQDYIQAYMWFNLAAAAGQSWAATSRDGLAQRMSPQQVAKGQRLANEFRRNESFAATKEKRPGSNPGTPEKVRATGTGFFLSESGYLATSYHVVQGSQRITIRNKGRTLNAKLVKADPVNDLAILKVPGSFAALPVAPSRSVKLGQSVFTVGFPNTHVQGIEPKLTRGEVNGLTGMHDDPRHFQVSVPVQPGNSGGPLISLQGTSLEL